MDIKRKIQRGSRNERTVPTSKPDFYPQKCLLWVYWNAKDLVHCERLEHGRSINADIYCLQLNRVNEQLRRKWPALVNIKGVILQHDNAHPHAAKQTQEKIRSLG